RVATQPRALLTTTCSFTQAPYLSYVVCCVRLHTIGLTCPERGIGAVVGIEIAARVAATEGAGVIGVVIVAVVEAGIKGRIVAVGVIAVAVGVKAAVGARIVTGKSVQALLFERLLLARLAVYAEQGLLAGNAMFTTHRTPATLAVIHRRIAA